jgi:hypothetical protein
VRPLQGCPASLQQRYRERRSLAPVPNRTPEASSPGPVESGVEAEIAGLAESRPGLAQIALALARIMDNPRALSSQPPAAKVLTTVLDKLHSVGAQSRRGRLAVVRTLTERGGA